MHTLIRSVLTSAVLALGALAAPASADQLSMQGSTYTGNMPARGTHMNSVLRQFGEPTQRLSPVGGGLPQHPPITRWVYPGYTVYFERELVISAVANRNVAQPSASAPPQ
jgi:hypothetical protein